MCKKRALSFFLAVFISIMSVMNVRAEGKEKIEESGSTKNAGNEENTEDVSETEEVTTVEEANITMDSYDDEETAWETIYIDSVEDFKAFSRNCWLDTWSQDKKVYLRADLDLTGSDFISIPTFGGYFDGQGHMISGLSIRDEISYTGLFCYTQKRAVIVNLNVKGAVRPAGAPIVVGGIVGSNSGIIMNCSFDGTIEGNDYVGGITGFNEISGILIDCQNAGRVTGTHYTGGIAGDNMGNMVGCVNEADVNISNTDKGKSLEDINIEQYTSGLLNAGDGAWADKEESTNNNTIDAGGIAGLSTGIIQFCVNKGTVGYEHVGYNIGGIVGRQSGYVYACENTGTVYGRKDVGGIAGQTEPYIAIDLTKDIAYQLAENIDKMHDLTSRMLDDAGTESDTISGRLSIIQEFTGRALDDTSFLADRTVEWTDGMISSANDAINRLDYVMDETAKDGGMLDKTREAAGKLEDTVEALDIYQYMTPEERERYENAKEGIHDANKKRAGYYADAVQAYNNLYIDRARDEYSSNESDLMALMKNGNVTAVNGSSYLSYIDVAEWVHYYDDGNGNMIQGEFPASEEPQRGYDQTVLNRAAELTADNAEQIAEDASAYAKSKYSDAQYSADLKKNTDVISDIVLAHESEMTENAVNELKDASENLSDAGREVETIVDTLNEMPDISLPQLGEGYRARTNSLSSNLAGLSENIGYLNNEMSSTNDVLLGDLAELNDQFSTVMRLYTDAVDGVLDMDYSNIYEDNSSEDAETSTEATIADCKNNGIVRGDINISGIAGTMAIEYDFDLESDVTGIEDAKLNSTFLTKCVLRNNVNDGRITAQKSCVGGICGLQEMGTALWCENYGRIVSTSGSYVGGIAGESRSYIVESYAKCALAGDEYVAGIAGAASSIKDCCAMVRIRDAAAFAGAIAGKANESGTITNNFFVSDEIAGIDRISYSGKAEPISYREMLEIEGLPNKFRMMTITFYADEEEIKTLSCSYGGTVTDSMYPEIPVKEGFYADWDIKELANVVHDEDITVEYVRYLTTIASEQIRENKQSALLVDGMFEKEAALDIAVLDSSDIMLKDVAEHWAVSFPYDGNSAHQVRYQAPQGRTEGVSIYVKNGGEWILVDTELMGIYHLFTVDGTEAEIVVCIHEKGIMDYLVYIILTVIVALTAAVLIGRKVVKKKKDKKEKEEAVQEDFPVKEETLR